MKLNKSKAVLFDELYDNLIKELSLYKGESWKHEKEYRLLYITDEFKNGGEVPFSELNIKPVNIYVGLKCSKNNKYKLQKIANEMKVNFNEIHCSTTEYKFEK